jgi:hypothetical protein
LEHRITGIPLHFLNQNKILNISSPRWPIWKKKSFSRRSGIFHIFVNKTNTSNKCFKLKENTFSQLLLDTFSSLKTAVGFKIILKSMHLISKPSLLIWSEIFWTGFRNGCSADFSTDQMWALLPRVGSYCYLVEANLWTLNTSLVWQAVDCSNR